MGYKTCHVLNSSLDSTVCAKDCDRLKKHKFAKDCKDRGGLYKCCIRRDAAFCHECRYIGFRSDQVFGKLGPGWPSVCGPRMDCRVQTSMEVVNISRLASRLRR